MEKEIKEFNLSERIWEENDRAHWIHVMNVKEFIRRLKDIINIPMIQEAVDKLCGEKLR